MAKPGRPKEYGERISTQLRLSVPLHNRLHNEALRRDVSRNKILEWALERWLQEKEGEPLL